MGEKGIFEIAESGKDEELGIPSTIPESKYLGLYLCIKPENQKTSINFTGPPGSATGLYMSLMAQLSKSGWNVRKVDEWIEVSPTHAQYYNLTVSQKQQLESTIRVGIDSAARSVAEYELAKHDLRKYKEILDYFKEGVEKDGKKGNEHSLRAMFIDQIDVHTGDGISLRSIVQRWPTIIADFMKLSIEEVTIEKVETKLEGISKAEAVILTTKNKLFIEWEKMFRDAAIERYESLIGMTGSRKKMIEEYRNWLKPFISKYKMIKLGHELPGVRANDLGNAFNLVGQAGFSNFIRVWAWKPLRVPTYQPKLKEMVPEEKDFMINPYDEVARNRLILDKEHGGKYGLANLYPFLAEKAKDGLRADSIAKEIMKGWEDDYGLRKEELYYQLIDFQINRIGGKFGSFEFEDITFGTKLFVISQNVMLVRMMDLYCREKEFESYIDEILGVKSGEESPSDMAKRHYPELYPKEEEEKKIGLGIKTPEMPKELVQFIEKLRNFKMEKYLLLAKRGPYEGDFKDTLTKYYFVTAGKSFGEVKNFLKEKMGVG